MGLFSRLKTGFVLSVASLRVLGSHPKLAVYPLISGIATTVFALALLGPLFLVSGGDPGPVEAIGLFVVLFGTTFIASLFNAGLVYSVGEVFRGNDPSVRRGLGAASSQAGILLVWSFISAVVGVIIRALESRGEIGARIAAMIFSVGWAITTFFVIPVIVFEDVSPKSMFTRSASVFTDTWGETAGAKLGLGIIPALIMFGGIALAALVAFALPTTATFVTAVVIAVGAFVVSVLVNGVITAVAKTALYVYATESIEPEEFRDFDFESLFEDGDSSGRGGLGSATRGI